MSFASYRSKPRLSVSREMLIDDVVICPKSFECGHRYQYFSIGSEFTGRKLQRSHRVRHVLENVQHEDETELVCQTKSRTKIANVNAGAMRCIIVHQSRGQLDTLYIAKLQQLVKKQTVAAA